MSQNRSDYIAAQERLLHNTSGPSSHENVAALAPQLSIDRRSKDGAAEEALPHNNRTRLNSGISPRARHRDRTIATSSDA
jgi:hypothetical protein